MYSDYFGLTENPFSIAPDPRYLYLSAYHCEALAHLRYGMQTNGGFVLLTGEVGAGKTTLCRSLLDQLPQDIDVAFVFNPKVTVIELLQTLCDELRIPYSSSASNKQLVERLTLHLLETHARGQKTVLIIDEAQNLTVDVLEQLRLLTNLETDRHKLLQIVLLGQPELRHLLNRSDLRQLAQRVTARYHLEPLPPDEIMAYVAHRLDVAGCSRPLFPNKLANLLWRATGGVPRLINLVCDRALLGAYARDQRAVDRPTLRQAIREVFDPSSAPSGWPLMPVLVTLFLILMGGVGFWAWRWGGLGFGSPEHSPAVARTTIIEETTMQGQTVPAESPAVASASLPRDWPQNIDKPWKREMAFADLLYLWGINPSPVGQDFCSTAAEYGLSCLARQDSLENLRRLNRPAILTLYADDGRPFYAVLAKLVGSRAYFLVGTDTYLMDAKILEARWFGEFLLVWQNDPVINTVLQPGESGPAVDWLKNILAELGHYRQNGRETSLDGALLGALKQFQMHVGLTPDGVLGPLTMIYLNNARGAAGPRLQPTGTS
ncbi:MAG: AAA family ATPase [Deltaproteobacteria bacterium]|jgi:general secretion pathway protein A|nr:AAA family ATPase [Deltaproteobacteria bacterium]